MPTAPLQTTLLLDNMLVPLYVYSLAQPHLSTSARPRLSVPTALLLLAQVFTVLSHPPLLAALASELLKVDSSPSLCAITPGMEG